MVDIGEFIPGVGGKPFNPIDLLIPNTSSSDVDLFIKGIILAVLIYYSWTKLNEGGI